MVERDKIDDLGALWERLRAPEPDDAGAGNGNDKDAALAWMHAAWGSIETPPLVLPVSPFGRRRRKTVPKQTLVLIGALAASALCLLTLVPKSLSELNSKRTPGEEQSVVIQVPELVPHLAPEEHLASAPPLAALTPNAFEMRSGSVRLILLEDPADSVFDDSKTSHLIDPKQQED